MNENTFTYQADEYDVAITVASATVKMGATRTAMLVVSELPEEASDTVVQRLWIDIVAATIKVENSEEAARIVPWPLDVSDFAELPEPLGVAWENAVHDANPHWAPWKQEQAVDPGESNGDETDNR